MFVSGMKGNGNMTEDARIEKVARALCKHAGEDPNQTSTVPGSINLGSGILNHDEPLAKWRSYIQEARKFIVMHDALSS